MLFESPLKDCNVSVIEELSKTAVPVKSDFVFTSNLYVEAPVVLFQFNVGDVDTPIAPFDTDDNTVWLVVKLNVLLVSLVFPKLFNAVTLQ